MSKEEKMQVYLDHAATTPVFPEVVDIMSDFLRNCYGNPSSHHSIGAQVRSRLEQARAQVAALLDAPADTITFTSGGTEADNLVLFGSAALADNSRRHIITSAVEHHAVLESCEELERMGYELTILPVDEYGMVQPESLRAAMRPDTLLVSVMHANNEVGTVNPIEELAAIAHEQGALFHTDAVQSVGKIACSVRDLDVDFLTCSSHKINGPKGVGALYMRQGLALQRRAWGGGQERTLRSGTENTAGIIGFGQAAELTAAGWQQHTQEWQELRDLLIQQTLTNIPDSYLHGHPSRRLPHNVNFGFPGIEGEALLDSLNYQNIACSTGSACSSGRDGQSHVLTAMGLPGDNYASLRLSIGLGVDREQILYTAKVLQDRVSLLRQMSPFYRPGER